jgi:hypothetical protein
MSFTAINQQCESKLHESQMLSTANQRLSQSEYDLKQKLEYHKSKSISHESTLRITSQENYTLKSEIKNLQTDIINMVNVEDR